MNTSKALKFLSDFERACRDEDQEVSINGMACENAKKFFQLNSDEEIFKFIGNGGLETPQFIKGEEWRYAPAKEKPISAYSYLFKSGSNNGYLAIAYLPKRKAWHLKSLTKHDPIKHIKATRKSKKSLT